MAGPRGRTTRAPYWKLCLQTVCTAPHRFVLGLSLSATPEQSHVARDTPPAPSSRRDVLPCMRAVNRTGRCDEAATR